ncbi:MAG: HNH endonuclease [Leptospiraceae bacterium]|nr:HNH endonuclease [Leptospiraceae bacterium]
MDTANPIYDQPIVSYEEIEKERNLAKRLKKTPWWKKKRSSGKCYYCGQKFPVQDLTMDHKMPLSRGGKSTKENIVPACLGCNQKRKETHKTFVVEL